MTRYGFLFASTAFFLFACGSDGPDPGNGGTDGGGVKCGNCATGFRCGSSGKCELNPSGFWVPTVTFGTISEKDPATGSSWDTLGGLPDPKVCLTINGNRGCTKAMQDTLKPSWNAAGPAQTATALQSGIKVEFLDEDLSSDDTICTGNLAISLYNFQSGSAKVSCDYKGTVFAEFGLMLTAQ